MSLRDVLTRPLEWLSRRWLLSVTWKDLLLASWPVPVSDLQPLVPRGLDIDTFNGTGWVSIVPFLATDTRLRRVPIGRDFGEVNLRTYVRHRHARGVVFLSIECAGEVASRIGRHLFHLPFMNADVSLTSSNGQVHLTSRRPLDGATPPAELIVDYAPQGRTYTPNRGTLEDFLTSRPSLFVAGPAGMLFKADVTHAPWQVQPARLSLTSNSIAQAAGISLPSLQPHALFAAVTQSRVFPPVPVDGSL